MFYFLAFLCGAILAVMIQWNGDLSAQVGAYHAALYIHIVGAVFAALVLVVKRKPFALAGRVPLWMYLGGAIGVLTTLLSVAGVALMLEWGIVRGNYSTITGIAIKNSLIQSADRDSRRNYPDKAYGWGRLNVYQTFEDFRIQ